MLDELKSIFLLFLLLRRSTGSYNGLEVDYNSGISNVRDDKGDFNLDTVEDDSLSYKLPWKLWRSFGNNIRGDNEELESNSLSSYSDEDYDDWAVSMTGLLDIPSDDYNGFGDISQGLNWRGEVAVRQLGQLGQPMMVNANCAQPESVCLTHLTNDRLITMVYPCCGGDHHCDHVTGLCVSGNGKASDHRYPKIITFEPRNG